MLVHLEFLYTRGYPVRWKTLSPMYLMFQTLNTPWEKVLCYNLGETAFIPWNWIFSLTQEMDTTSPLPFFFLSPPAHPRPAQPPKRAKSPTFPRSWLVPATLLERGHHSLSTPPNVPRGIRS